MSTPPLATHQREAIAWIHDVGRGLLGDEPGLGKSRTSIEAFDGGRVLVVAPAMVIAGGTWEDELALWAREPDGFTVAPYSMLNSRVKTGKGSGSKPVNALRPEFKGKWDAVIVDEAHYTKGRKTSWTWAVEEIAKNAGAVLEMSGTPIPNWAHEMYTLLRVLKPEEAKRGHVELGSFHRWAARWFVQTPNQWNPRATDIGGLLACGWDCEKRPPHDPCEHYLDFMTANFGGQFLRRLRDDVLKDLPPLTEQVIHIEMDMAQRRMYREMKKDYLTHNANGDEVVAWTSGSKNVILDRLTTSGWFLDQDGEPRGGKFDRLRFDLESRSRPTLVLAHYQDTVEACARVAESLGARAGYVHGSVPLQTRGRAVRDFKEGRLDVLVGSLETVAEGLTLTVADMAIFVEKSFKPSRNVQAMRRIHRMGQTRPVTVLDYVTSNSVDSKKRELLALKTDHQMRMMSARDFSVLL